MNVNLKNQDCILGMKELSENSVDSIVTDPPYELGFMGKSWDSTGIAYNTEVWKECLRVLKPGGHLLAFGGTRTYHRMACAIEDSGFEIRDQLQWLYGSGFPKSMDISKAIDKSAGAERKIVGIKKHGGNLDAALKNKIGFLQDEANRNNKKCFGYGDEEITEPATEEAKKWNGWGTALKPANEICVLAQKKISIKDRWNDLLGKILCQLNLFVKDVEKNSQLSNQEQKEVSDFVLWIAEKKFNIPEDLYDLMDMLPLKAKMENLISNIVSLWLNTLVEILKHLKMSTTEMKIVLTTDLKILNCLPWQNMHLYIIQEDAKNDGMMQNVLLAEQVFNAVYTKLIYTQKLFAQENVISKEKNLNLRPNSSPIVLARKPLSEKTIAANVLKHSTGGLNIDACRIATQDKLIHGGKLTSLSGDERTGKAAGMFVGGAENTYEQNSLGRFPANIILDEEAGKILDEQSGISKSSKPHRISSNNSVGYGSITKRNNVLIGYEDIAGGASRFFYCPKTSQSERNEGLEHRSKQNVNDGRKTSIDNAFQRGDTERLNIHPTVKPIALMEYLIKLVTPESGTVLDPFMGSGSTGIAAVRLNRSFIGFELEKEYFEIAESRINHHDKEKESTLSSFFK